MKEQDFIHDITQKAKEIPIPDSISPESMKQMLDENKSIYTENRASSDTGTRSDKKHPGTDNRNLRRFTAAACLIMCLAGTFGIYEFVRYQQPESSRDYTPSSDGNANSIPETKPEQSDDEDLASLAVLSSPASYKEYYQTLKDAYQKYYDSLTDVTTYTNEIALEDVAIAGVWDMAEAESDTATSGFKTEMSSVNRDSATKKYSTTNTQEQTVDEGDVVKTDGTYIYKVISGFDNHTGYTGYTLTITETDNGSLTAIASIDLNDVIKKSKNDYIHFQEFYLYHDKLIFLFSKSDYSTENVAQNTYIAIYDLKDKENPAEIKTLSQSGWYQSSRISDGYLYTISNFAETSLEDENNYKNYIPYVNGNPIPCPDIYYPENVLLETTHVITSLNLDDPKAFTDSKAIPSAGNSYYVSDSSIFLYSTLYTDSTKTEITKVSYKDGSLTLGNSAVITGYLYDSFALNEYNGYLRIVATLPANSIALLRLDPKSDSSSTTSVTEDLNTLYILDENMELTGKISGIAPGERIYSARFMGDTGYFVTYKNTDPLFSVDLSDPTNPSIIGSLKITGFSEYLHFYDENMLLGIGQERDPNTQELLGLKLSMFDISDPANVTEKDKYIIENSMFSEALNNHKAIMIDPGKNVFGFLYGGDANDGYRYEYHYSTYTYDAEEGFIQTASYLIDDGSEYESDAVRGIYIGDYFYLTTNQSITGYQLGSEDPIAVIYFK